LFLFVSCLYYGIFYDFHFSKINKITADQRCQIEALACEKPEKLGRPITNWTAREIADELKKRKIVSDISPRHAARLLKRG
jgi:hypothetical protein